MAAIHIVGPGQDGCRPGFDTRFIWKSVPKIPASLAWQGRSNEDGVSVTKKSADRSWIEQPVHRWVSCGAIVYGYRFTRRNWEHSCRSTNIPRTMGTDILGLLPCRDCRLLPKLRCLLWGLNAGVAN